VTQQFGADSGHADGSKQEVTKNGIPAETRKAREEYEPLGQSVRLSAPVVVDPPNGQPLPDAYNSSNEMMAFALAATSKPDKKTKKKSGWGVGSIGEFVVDVEKPMIDTTDTGMVDASQSGNNNWWSPFHFSLR
jgi:hypothetical protein